MALCRGVTLTMRAAPARAIGGAASSSASSSRGCAPRRRPRRSTAHAPPRCSLAPPPWDRRRAGRPRPARLPSWCRKMPKLVRVARADAPRTCFVGPFSLFMCNSAVLASRGNSVSRVVGLAWCDGSELEHGGPRRGGSAVAARQRQRGQRAGRGAAAAPGIRRIRVRVRVGMEPHLARIRRRDEG